MSKSEPTEHAGDRSNEQFSIDDIDASLEAIANEDLVFRAGVIKAYEAFRETQQAEDSNNNEPPMRIYARDSFVGAELPIEFAATTSDIETVTIEQETRKLKLLYYELLATLTQDWQPPENLNTSDHLKTPSKHVLDPKTGNVISIYTHAEKKYYSLREAEEFGKQSPELVWKNISFSLGRLRADPDQKGKPSETPDSIIFGEDGYAANFPIENAGLMLNDARNPRNWGSKHMEEFVRGTLLPLAHLPALDTDDNGVSPLRPDRSEPESEVDRAHGIALRAKRSIDENLEFKADKEYALDATKGKLRTIVTARPDILGSFVVKDDQDQLDFDATFNSLVEWYHSEVPPWQPGQPGNKKTLQEITEAARVKFKEMGAPDNEAVRSAQDAALELIMKLSDQQNAVANADKWIDDSLTFNENQYDKGVL